MPSVTRSQAAMQKLPQPDAQDYRAILEECKYFILPEIVPGSGQFPGSVARAIDTDDEKKVYPLSEIEQRIIDQNVKEQKGTLEAFCALIPSQS